MSPTTATTTTTEPEPERFTSAAEALARKDKSGGHGIAIGYNLPGIPKFDDPYKKRQWVKEHMAGAFRVFARKGYTEGLAGHISVRDPVDPNTFWINPLGVHFGMLKASDMVHVDEEGNVIGGNRVAVNGAGFMIHSSIHKRHPNVNAACHTHSVYGKAWSTFGLPIEMLNQDACLFYGTQTVYKSFGGVVLSSEEGQHIAEALGEDNKVAVLQNHGLITVGETVDEAAALYTLYERACEIQLLAEAAAANGVKKQYVGPEQAEFTFKSTFDPDSLYGDFQGDYQYEIWKDPSLLQ